MLNKDDRRILRKIRNQVLRGRWRRGNYYDGSQYCLVGLINKETGEDEHLGSDEARYDGSRNSILSALYAEINEWSSDITWGSVEEWNDDNLRTSKNVVNLIENTIARQ